MATERNTTAEIDLRWEIANYGRPSRFSNADGIFLHPTKRHERIGRDLEDLAAMLVDDGVWDEEMQNVEDNLMDMIGETWDVIEERFKAWASRAHIRRDAIRAEWAAEKAAKAGTAA